MTPASQALVDCQEALRAYDELWAQSRRVLCVQGMSGIGKSRLLRHLFEHYETARPRALLDLAALPLTRADIIGELTDQLTATSHGTRQVTVQVRTGPFSRIDRSPAVVAFGGEPEFAALDRLEHLRSAEWVLLVDHCDELDADPQLRRWFEGRLLARLLGGFPGLRVVLAAEHGPRGPAHERRSLAMRTWTAAETRHFLSAYGFADDDSKAVHEVWDGLAFFVELEARERELSARAGAPFELVDMERQGARGWLFDRVLGRLPTSLCEAAKAACLLRRFNLETLSAVGFPSEPSDAEYEALTRRSWVLPHGEGGFEVDRRVRRVCAAWWLDERPDAFGAFHTRARRLFERRGEPLDALYHLISLDPEAGVEPWARAFDNAERDELAILARLLLLPEIWSRLGPAGRTAWQARVEGWLDRGPDGPGASREPLAQALRTASAIEQHEHTQAQSYSRTPGELDMRKPGGTA